MHFCIMFYVIILYCSGRILVFYGVCTHHLCLFSQGSGQMMDKMDTFLGPVVLERKEGKNEPKQLLGNLLTTLEENPSRKRDTESLTSNYTAGAI